MYIMLNPASGQTSTQVEQQEKKEEDNDDPLSTEGGHGSQVFFLYIKGILFLSLIEFTQ